MAPRFSSGVKVLPGFVFDGFLNAIVRRGYTAEPMAMAASERATTSTPAAGGVLPATRSDGVIVEKEESERSTEKAAVWIPDPVTGCYRPESNMDEMDAVDLRAKLLKPRRNTVN